jgi:hypothetical protein
MFIVDRCGNWDASDLTPAQLIYAAADAYYSRAIFIGLFNLCATTSSIIPVVRGTNILPQLFDEQLAATAKSPAPAKTQAKKIGSMSWNDVPNWCDGLVDIKAPKYVLIAYHFMTRH